jgi:Protein of unknown function (DUF3489)
MWLRGALRQCGGWRRTNLKEDPNAQAQIGTHKNIALVEEQDCSPQIRGAVESPVVDRGPPPRQQTSPLITMLRAPSGATVAAMMMATEWQQNSVRGFLAGVIRKKLGLNLVSEESDDGRVYRIRDRKRRTVSIETAQTA